MNKNITTLIFLLFNIVIYAQADIKNKAHKDSIIEKYLKNGAYKYHYTMQGWSDNIDKALQKDSTIAVLWQLKALPY